MPGQLPCCRRQAHRLAEGGGVVLHARAAPHIAQNHDPRTPAPCRRLCGLGPSHRGGNGGTLTAGGGGGGNGERGCERGRFRCESTVIGARNRWGSAAATALPLATGQPQAAWTSNPSELST